MANETSAAGPAPKVDPESPVLRAKPELAARFKRGLIIGAAAAGAGAVGTLGYVSLRPQRRAMVAWRRVVFPDGGSIVLDDMRATDPAGYAGLEGKVDTHTWQQLKGVAISTLLGVGAELQFTGDGDLVQALRQSTQQSVSRAGDQLTSKTLDVRLTITVRPGAPVRLVVNRDLILAPWRG